MVREKGRAAVLPLIYTRLTQRLESPKGRTWIRGAIFTQGLRKSYIVRRSAPYDRLVGSAQCADDSALYWSYPAWRTAPQHCSDPAQQLYFVYKPQPLSP